jgi:cytochrome c5
MKLKIVFAGLLALGIYGCDSNQSTSQSSATEQKTEIAQPAPAPVEQAAPQVTEQPVAAEPKPQESQQTVATAAQPLSGEAVYKKTCIGCHATGAANAPKVGDKTAWKPRIEKGMDVLMQSALNGVPGTAMMKRGTCASCTDADLKAAIEYMVGKSK